MLDEKVVIVTGAGQGIGEAAALLFAEEGVDWSQTTPLPMGRPGEPSEVAETALWLLSPRSSYITGQAISVDGGSTTR